MRRAILLLVLLLLSMTVAHNVTAPVCYRRLRVDCAKCRRECGGDVPVLVPDAYCRRCIPQCYR